MSFYGGEVLLGAGTICLLQGKPVRWEQKCAELVVRLLFLGLGFIKRTGNTHNKHLSAHHPDITSVSICSLFLASVKDLACFPSESLSLPPLSRGNHYHEFGVYSTSKVWGCLNPTFRTRRNVKV